MQHPTDRRVLVALLSSIAFIAGCERALEVVDQLQPQAPGEGEATNPPPVQNASCACASSPSLMALTCGGGEVPLVGDDVVQTTFDGSVVVFNRCGEDTFSCEIMVWNGNNPESIGAGYLYGISASGQRVFTALGDGQLVDVADGDIIPVPVYTIPGRGSLNAAGDSVIGALYGEDSTQLARFDAGAGEVETLGALDGQPTAVYVNPEGTALAGWTLDLDSEALDLPVTYGAYRWSSAGGLRFDFAGVPDDVAIWPESISADGSIIAGRSVPDQAHFVWSEATGYTELAPASWRSETFLNADGSVVLGSLVPDGGDSAAFRWTTETGAVILTPGRDSLALDISEAGDVIVAYSWEEAQNEGLSPEETFIWNANDGTRTLDEVLSLRGVDTSGWEFATPRQLSGDGRVLLGRGTCGGVPTLYRVVLSD